MGRFNTVEEYVKSVYERLYPREKVVVDEIMSKGYFVKYDLMKQGLDASQGPRAVKDLNDRGIPVKSSSRIRVAQARNPIMAYKFGSVDEIEYKWIAGRKWKPKVIKTEAAIKQGLRCAFCGRELPLAKLQLDHKLPVEYFGELRGDELTNPDNYLLGCKECNMIKRKAVELGCKENCYKTNDMDVIKSCYWYDPRNFKHICMVPEKESPFIYDEQNLEIELMNLERIAEKHYKPLSIFLSELANKQAD